MSVLCLWNSPFKFHWEVKHLSDKQNLFFSEFTHTIYHKRNVPSGANLELHEAWNEVGFYFELGGLDMVRRNSGAGCRESMYTSTAGSNRTAGRDGQGMGWLRLTTRMTPFNPVGAENKDGQSMQIQALHCSAPLQINPASDTGYKTPQSQNWSTSSTSATLIQAKRLQAHRPGTSLGHVGWCSVMGKDHLRM